MARFDANETLVDSAALGVTVTAVVLLVDQEYEVAPPMGLAVNVYACPAQTFDGFTDQVEVAG